MQCERDPPAPDRRRLGEAEQLLQPHRESRCCPGPSNPPGCSSHWEPAHGLGPIGPPQPGVAIGRGHEQLPQVDPPDLVQPPEPTNPGRQPLLQASGQAHIGDVRPARIEPVKEAESRPQPPSRLAPGSRSTPIRRIPSSKARVTASGSGSGRLASCSTSAPSRRRRRATTAQCRIVPSEYILAYDGVGEMGFDLLASESRPRGRSGSRGPSVELRRHEYGPPGPAPAAPGRRPGRSGAEIARPRRAGAGRSGRDRPGRGARPATPGSPRRWPDLAPASAQIRTSARTRRSASRSTSARSTVARRMSSRRPRSASAAPRAGAGGPARRAARPTRRPARPRRALGPRSTMCARRGCRAKRLSRRPCGVIRPGHRARRAGPAGTGPAASAAAGGGSSHASSSGSATPAAAQLESQRREVGLAESPACAAGVSMRVLGRVPRADSRRRAACRPARPAAGRPTRATPAQSQGGSFRSGASSGARARGRHPRRRGRRRW